VKVPLPRETFWAGSPKAMSTDAFAGLIPDSGGLPGWHGFSVSLSASGCSDLRFGYAVITEIVFKAYARLPSSGGRMFFFIMRRLISSTGFHTTELLSPCNFQPPAAGSEVDHGEHPADYQV
jgi:hypothetical protein